LQTAPHPTREASHDLIGLSPVLVSAEWSGLSSGLDVSATNARLVEIGLGGDCNLALHGLASSVGLLAGLCRRGGIPE